MRATANFTVFSALAGPGGKIMGMNLVDGGHLSHGHSASYTSKFFQAKSYKVDHTTYLIDYEQLERDVLEFKPKFLIAGISAYSRNLDYSLFRDIADKVGAILMADMAHVSGLVAAGQVSQSPFEFAHVVTTTTHKTLRGPRGAMIFTRKDGEYLNMSNEVSKAHFPGLTGGPHNNKIYALAHALGEAAKPEFQSYAKQVIKNAQKMAKEFIANGFNVLSGGTDNHMIIVDVAKWAPKPIFTGAHVQILCDAVEISLNMNSVPGDLSPFNPSGIRIGTPKVTIRGCQESEMIYIVSQLIKAIKLSYQIAEKAANERPEFVLKSGKVSKDGFKEFMLKHFNEDIEKLKAENNSFISKYEIYSSCGY
ncbi:MAG: glycine hydroxymethyltransferase shm1 [Paramarteilia canceri]